MIELLDSQKNGGRRPKYDLINRRFGRLKVLYRTDYENRDVTWMCICDCGSFAKVIGYVLASGASNSCGCLRREIASEKFKTHGHATGGTTTRTYTSWTGMKRRCNNKKDKHVYHRYGGRGITVCKRWEVFENFYEDMGDAPLGMSIERKDNDKGYDKENCKWATPREQANNTSKNKYYEYNGELLTVPQISRLVGIDKMTITSRMRRGMSFSDAVSNKIKTKRLFTHDGITMSLTEWSEYLGIKRRSLGLRLDRGWSVEKTLATPLRGSQ